MPYRPTGDGRIVTQRMTNGPRRGMRGMGMSYDQLLPAYLTQVGSRFASPQAAMDAAWADASPDEEVTFGYQSPRAAPPTSTGKILVGLGIAGVLAVALAAAFSGRRSPVRANRRAGRRARRATRENRYFVQRRAR